MPTKKPTGGKSKPKPKPPAKKRPQRRPKGNPGLSAAHAVNERARKVWVTLQTFHRVGDDIYGPGRCQVPKGRLLTVLEMDRLAAEVEHNLFSSRSGLIVPDANRQPLTVVVAGQNFDRLWQGDTPVIFTTESGKGMDIGTGQRF